jgi:hypothetical protein
VYTQTQSDARFLRVSNNLFSHQFIWIILSKVSFFTSS